MADNFKTKTEAEDFADNCGREVTRITYSKTMDLWTVWT